MNYHMNKLDSILPKLLNMLEYDEWAFKKKKDIVLLV
jgi:hypothetical protein